MRAEDLRDILKRIDHKGYPAYKDTKGSYDFGDYVLGIDHVQGDPFAAPSKLSVKVKGKAAGFDRELYATKSRKVSLEDHILRNFGRQLREFTGRTSGSGKSGNLSVSSPGQEVLKRSAVSIDAEDGSVLVRFQAGFPAHGRTVTSMELIRILFDHLPIIVEKSLFAKAYRADRLKALSDLADDRDYIRSELKKRGLVAFVADGSVLPRRSGVSNLPMQDAVTFTAPEEQSVTLNLPHRGELRGMGIKRGVTLIVGGGYHGKSTLLSALELGVYDHIAKDGREYVITDDTAVSIRAEDGRSVRGTDISMFIRNLPSGRNTSCFYTEDASGSTSQAANTVEAMEAGSRCFLIDEDTSATNFMIRDELMQKVVSREEEPIIPFIDRVRELYETHGISTVLVAGSSGSYFHKADTVIQMKEYRPYDITGEAKAAAESYPLRDEYKLPAVAPDFHRVFERPKGAKDDRVKTKTFGTDGFSVNHENVELRYIKQLADIEQVNALAKILITVRDRYFDGRRTLTECVEALWKEIEEKGFAAVGGAASDNLALPRKQEIYAMISRVRD